MTNKALAKAIKDWRKDHNDLRFGQWLWNLMNSCGKWESPEGNNLFFISDRDLAKIIEEDK